MDGSGAWGGNAAKIVFNGRKLNRANGRSEPRLQVFAARSGVLFEI